MPHGLSLDKTTQSLCYRRLNQVFDVSPSSWEELQQQLYRIPAESGLLAGRISETLYFGSKTATILGTPSSWKVPPFTFSTPSSCL